MNAETPSLQTQDFWVPTQGGHELHVAEAKSATVVAPAIGIVFLPGIFSDGRFFLNARGEGPARYFVDEGCVAYVASLRGHGKSRWPAKRAWNWNFDTYVQQDIPDLLRGVRERHIGPLFVLAHSMAGYAVLASLGVPAQAPVDGVVTLSSAVNDFSEGGFKKRWQFAFSRIVSALLGRFPAKALKQGPCDEPAGLMRQFSDWAPSGAFRSADRKTDYWQALRQVKVPVLAGIGAADLFHASPARAEKLVAHVGSADKTLLVFGRKQGQSTDYGHFDLVRGAAAQREVLPVVLSWMRQLAGRA